VQKTLPNGGTVQQGAGRQVRWLPSTGGSGTGATGRLSSSEKRNTRTFQLPDPAHPTIGSNDGLRCICFFKPGGALLRI
jgi:hypothetical protein